MPRGSLRSEEQRSGANVLVVNQTMADQLWPGEDPGGQMLEHDEKPRQLIGVARDIRSALPLGPQLPAVYRPLTTSGFAAPSRQGVTILVRAQPGFDAATRVRQELEKVDPNVTVFDVLRMEDLVEQVYQMARFRAPRFLCYVPR